MASEITTPDWTRFRAAASAGTAPAEIARACDLAAHWLDLAPDEQRDRVEQSIRDDAHARWMLQALTLMRARLRGDGAGEEARTLEATVAIGRAVTDRFPSAALPPPAPDPYREALVAATPSLLSAIHAADIGEITPAKVESLAQAIEAFAQAASGAPADVAREFASRLAVAWWTMARARLALGRNDEAREAYALAASCYAQAGDEAAVEASRERIRDLDAHRGSDFDSAADREVRALLVDQDPMGRVKALVRLAGETGNAGDRFGAARTAKQAADVLAQAGFPDPEPDLDAATARWIATAMRDAIGTELVAKICDAAGLWAAILGARANAPGNAEGERMQRALAGIQAFTTRLFEQCARSDEEAASAAAKWLPAGRMPLERPDLTPQIERADKLAAIDSALVRLRAAVNRRPAKRHVADAATLRTQAESLGARIHSVRAAVEQMRALFALHRDDEVLPVAHAALQTLLGERAPALSSFTTRYERELYLTLIDYQARALAARRDDAAILALCEPVLRDIESERTRVSSPYAQSAFLATRSQLYEFVAAAAYRTGNLDLVLATSELLKSRAATAGRLTSADTSELDAQLRAIDDALQIAGEDEARDLGERRSWIVTARSIARARARTGELPQSSIAAVQSVLPENTAAITWLFAGSDVLIVLGIRRDGSRPSVVTLDPTRHGQLRDYLACVTALAHARPNFRKLVPRIDELVAALGPMLLPADIRDFVAGQSHLILCPHRALHLFPFHAAPWVDRGATGFLIEHFDVSYVPNLTSLLVPWHGQHDGRVLAVGVGRFDDPRVPPLPNANREARAVAKAHDANGAALLDATRAQFMAQPLAALRCVHFATHATSVLAVGDDPMDAAMYFRDGPLSAWQLSTLPLRAELAVIAACHSGQRAIAGRGLAKLPGDDLFGIAGALFEAGVAAVLGTLWPVHDEAAKALVIAFHRAYAKGSDPASALAHALRAHLAGGQRELFFWAPFFVSSLGRR